MARKFSLRKALSNPATVRKVADHFVRKLQSPSQPVQLRAAKALLLLIILHVRMNFTPKR